MELTATSPALEGGLAVLRNAGVAGMTTPDAEALASELMDEAWEASGLSGLTDAELGQDTLHRWSAAEEALMASYHDGIRVFDARDAAPYRAAILFQELPAGASRTDFVDALIAALPALDRDFAERTVDGVISRTANGPVLPQYAPHPTDIFALVARTHPTPEEKRLHTLALSMRSDVPAAEPKHDEPVAPAAARAEAEARVEERRMALGMPSGLLRTVDYDPTATHTAPTWLVKGLFPDRGLGMLVGESQSGKSFLAVHAAISIARGLPFFGRKVKAGGVLYIAAEGGSSVIPRIKAADEAIGAMLPDDHLVRKGQPPMARAPIKVMTEAPNLSRDGDPAALSRTLRALHSERAGTDHPLIFVVVDTYHAVLCGGDEQSAADAGHALKPLREAAEELGLFLLIVHHPGKDLERGARGSSALRAAVDTEIELRVPGADGSKAKTAGLLRRATVTKQRDGAVGDELFCRLNTVLLGHDEDGDPWTTCTVMPCDAPALDVDGKPKGKGDVRLRRALEAMVAEYGADRVPTKMVRSHFYNAGPAEEKEDARRKAFDRARNKALEAGLIETDSHDEWVWFSKSARDMGQPDTP